MKAIRKLFPRLRSRRILVVALVAGAGLVVLARRTPPEPILHRAAPRAGAAARLTSPHLELLVYRSPYAYELVERSTGLVLLRETGTGLLDGPKLQTVRAAADVREIRQAGEGLDVSLAAQGSGGVTVSFRFSDPDILDVKIASVGGNGAKAISEAFADQGEHYYGLWEFPYGRDLDNRGADAPLLSPGYQKDVHHASARAPFYVSSAGYGLYVRSAAQGSFRVAVGGKTELRFHECPLSYSVIHGPKYADVMRRYNRLAGPPVMPPTWALGTMWWRDNAHVDLRPGVRDAQSNVIDDAVQLQRLHIPASALWIDRPYGTGRQGWGAFDFDDDYPSPRRMSRELDRHGIRLVVWAANRYWQLPADRGPDFTIGTDKGRVLDLRQAAPREWMVRGLQRFAALGVQGYKIDRGDEGDVPAPLQNEFATLVPQAMGDSLRPRWGDDFFLIARNLYDHGRQYSAVWNGDTVSSFSGLRMSIKNAVRCGAMDFPLWGCDTGGLLSPWAKTKTVPPTKELLARWLAFSSYTPVMETLIGPSRTPWAYYDGETVDLTRRFAALHHDLIPYTRSCLFRTTRDGSGVIRPLIYEFPDDGKLVNRWDEYMYGSELLVAPVLNSLDGGWLGHSFEFNPGYVPHVSFENAAREVYLPAGNWLDYNDRKTVLHGPMTVRLTPDLKTIPVFAREGAIVPRGDVLRANNNWSGMWAPHLRVEFFPAARDASRFDYCVGEESGSKVRTSRAITCTPVPGGYRFRCEDLAVDGELEIHCRAVSSVTSGGRALIAGKGYRFDPKSNVLRIPFHRSADVTVKGVSLFS